jgi:hypothetical protein
LWQSDLPVGGIAGTETRLTVSSWEAFVRWLDDLPVVEKVGPSEYLALQGAARAEAARAGEPVSAAFDGTWSYCPSGADNALYFACSATAIVCQSTHHRLVLWPR